MASGARYVGRRSRRGAFGAPAEASGARGPRRGAPRRHGRRGSRFRGTRPSRRPRLRVFSTTRGIRLRAAQPRRRQTSSRGAGADESGETPKITRAAALGAPHVVARAALNVIAVLTASMKSSRALARKTTPRGDAMHLDGAAAGASTRVVGVSYQPPYPMTAFELGETRGEPVATLVMLWAAHPYRLPHLRSSTRLATGVGAFLACAQPRANPPTRWARRRRTRRTAGRGVERLRRTRPCERGRR